MTTQVTSLWSFCLQGRNIQSLSVRCFGGCRWLLVSGLGYDTWITWFWFILWRRQVDSTTWYYLRETGFEDFPRMFYFWSVKPNWEDPQVGLRCFAGASLWWAPVSYIGICRIPQRVVELFVAGCTRSTRVDTEGWDRHRSTDNAQVNQTTRWSSLSITMLVLHCTC